MKTKCFLFAFVLCFLFIQVIFLKAQNSDKVITIKYKGYDCQVIDKKVRVRFKPKFDFINPDKSKIVNCDKLTPMLPYNSSFTFNKSMLRARVDNKRSINEIALLSSEDKLLRSFVIDYDQNISPELYCKYLIKNNPDIEIAEPYFVEKLQDLPNDPMLQQQSTLTRIKAFAAWNKGLIGDTSVTIGIIDSGMDISHEDIKDNLAINYGEIPANGIDDDNNGYIDDHNCLNLSTSDSDYKPYNVKSGNEHGQLVGGIIGATTNNGIGIAGMSYKCRIFPIKTTLDNGVYTYYLYPAIIYCAKMGFDVINLSIGKTSPYSEFEQSIIDFAVQSGCSIVASSGNVEGSNDIRSVYYPANYHGVLGVGAVDESDYTTGYSTLCIQTDVMAPAGSLTVSNGSSGYESSYTSTSFSSPAASAFVGLIRAKYPNLSSIQAIEFARQCTDDVSDNNTPEKFFMPGRINFEKVADINPMSIPSISMINNTFTDAQGAEIKRINYNGDQIGIKLDLFNYLSSVDNLTFTLSYKCNNAIDQSKITLDTSTLQLANAPSNQGFVLDGFKFRLSEALKDVVFFRVDIESTSGYTDHFLFRFSDIYDITTFTNESITFSASDYGLLGNSVDSEYEKGQGFSIANLGNIMFFGGLATTIDTYSMFSSFFGTEYKSSDFTPVKRLIGPDSNQMIVSFKDAEIINGQINTTFNLVPNKPILKIDLVVKNNGVSPLNKPSLGYVCDFDLGSIRTKNTCGYFEEALPDDFEQHPLRVAAEFMADFQLQNFIGALVFSDEQSARAQCGSYYAGDGIAQQTVTQLLNSDISYQYNLIGDAGLGLGTLFLESLQPGEERTCHIIIGYSKNKAELAKMLKDEYKNYYSVAEAVIDNVNIYPNPAKTEINIEFSEQLNEKSIIEVFSINGDKVRSVPCEISVKNIKIDIKNLNIGTYYLKIDNKYLGKFVKN